jgi:DNA transformation protein
MAVTESFKEFIVDQLSELGHFETKKMFGGVGFFIEGQVIAGIMDDVFMMKVTDGNRADFEAKGMSQWSPPGRNMKMPYYEVPQDILNDKTLLKEWSIKAFELAKK